jgi:putative tryptophan/tyrosine transport system substrate-binding protein
VKRREFIKLLAGAAATCPIAGLAQQQSPLVGVLSSTSLETYPKRIAAFRGGLREAGFVEGQNVLIEYQSPAGQREPVPAMVADLLRREIAVLVTLGTGDAARAVKASTLSIPIVFATGGDPVAMGLVPSLSRPGINITGTTWLANDLQAKQLELIRDLLPQARSVAYLQNPANFLSVSDAQSMEGAARALGCEVLLLQASNLEDIEAAFRAMAQTRIDALVLQPDPLFSTNRVSIIHSAAHLRLPAIYANSDFVADGGLLSYSADIKEAHRQAGVYAGRILKGEKPADLPVVQPTKFELAINLKTAKTLGLTFPPSLHLRADEVIE